MKKKLGNKKATLIIACRNEKDFISSCLDSVIGQDYPAELLEVFVMDGMSNDGTREILDDYIKNHPQIKVFDNKKVFQQHGFNMGITASTGDYIFIMGAHNQYPSSYVSECLKYAEKYKADNVGGRIEAKTNNKGLIAKAIIGSYTSPFGIGNATFRKKVSKPIYVDTVFGGCYRREVFNKIGPYNETLKRSQDMELNLRLVRSGGKILLVPDIVSYYYPVTDFLGFVRYSFKAGKGPIRAMRITGKPLKLMHYVPSLFVLGLILGPLTLIFNLTQPLFYVYLSVLAVYFLLSIVYSFKYSIKKKSISLIFLLPLIFFFKHFFYGLGSLYGIIKLHD